MISHRHWPGVISGMIIWAIWFVVVYALTGVGCEAGWETRKVPGGNLLSAMMLLTTVLALALIALAALSGYRGWQAGRLAVRPAADRRQRERFMGLIMLVLSLLAAVGTVMVAIPILMLSPCAA